MQATSSERETGDVKRESELYAISGRKYKLDLQHNPCLQETAVRRPRGKEMA